MSKSFCFFFQKEALSSFAWHNAMDDRKLVHMANEISRFFSAYPEAEAAAGIADHIRTFWTPGMRTALSARIAANTLGVQPLVVRALNERVNGDSPIKQEIAGPDKLGEMTSDAG